MEYFHMHIQCSRIWLTNKIGGGAADFSKLNIEACVSVWHRSKLISLYYDLMRLSPPEVFVYLLILLPEFSPSKKVSYLFQFNC